VVKKALSHANKRNSHVDWFDSIAPYIPHFRAPDIRTFSMVGIGFGRDSEQAEDLLLDGSEWVGKNLQQLAVFGEREVSISLA
jgi:hypothetical protein